MALLHDFRRDPNIEILREYVRTVKLLPGTSQRDQSRKLTSETSNSANNAGHGRNAGPRSQGVKLSSVKEKIPR